MPRGAARASISIAVSATATPVRCASRALEVGHDRPRPPARSARGRARRARRAPRRPARRARRPRPCAAAARAAGGVVVLHERGDRQGVAGGGGVAGAAELAAHVRGRVLGLAGQHGRLQVGHQPPVAARRRRLPRGAVERGGGLQRARARRRSRPARSAWKASPSAAIAPSSRSACAPPSISAAARAGPAAAEHLVDVERHVDGVHLAVAAHAVGHVPRLALEVLQAGLGVGQVRRAVGLGERGRRGCRRSRARSTWAAAPATPCCAR